MKTLALILVAVAAGSLVGCSNGSNGKDRQAAMIKRFSTLDSNFIADIAAANSNEQVAIADEQQQFSNAIMSLKLTLTNIAVASDELTNAISKQAIEMLLLLNIHKERSELRRAQATNTMLLAKLRWFYTNSMPPAEDAPSNDLDGITMELSSNLSKMRNDDIKEAGWKQVAQLLAKETNAPRPLTHEEAGRGGQAQTNLTFTNLQGRVYSNVDVVSSDPISVRFNFNGTESRIFLTNLPPEGQAMFHYDKAKADSFAANQAAERARDAIDAKIRREFNEQKSRILASERHVYANVLQIVTDGALVTPNNATSPPPEPWLLWQYPSAGLTDGKYLANVIAYPIGSYQYETVNHSSKTILRLTTNLSVAIRLDFFEKHPNWPLQATNGMTSEQVRELQREQMLEAQLRGIDYSP